MELCEFRSHLVGRNELVGLETAVDRAEDRADLPAEKGQDTNNNNCDQYQNKSVLYETLTFFLSEKTAKHSAYLHCDTID